MDLLLVPVFPAFDVGDMLQTRLYNSLTNTLKYSAVISSVSNVSSAMFDLI